MASCTLCASLLDVNRSEMRFTTRDEARSHAAQHLSQVKRLDDENCKSLEQVFDQCFPSFIVTPSKQKKKIVVKKEGRQSLLNICHTVFKGRISKDSPRANCQKCGSGIVLYGGTGRGLNFGFAINHASAHLGIDLFECRKCGHSFVTKNALCSHLRMIHGLRSLSEYFTDKSGDFTEEIIASIEQCFTEDNKNGPSDGKARVIRLKDVSMVCSKTNGSKLALERQLFCHRLIRQAAGDDRKMQCHLCLKKIYIKQEDGFRGNRAMEHALVHLKKPVFRCKVCSNVRHTRDVMQLHLKSAHALPLFLNYECLADEFHGDVLNMLRKCFEEEPNK